MELPNLIEGVAKHFLGEPSERKGKLVRWGTHGSMCCDLEKGTWYNFEDDVGGGVIDLVLRESPLSTRRDAVAFLQDEFDLDKDYKNDNDLEGVSMVNTTTPRRVVATFQYRDEDGELLFEVDRQEWIKNGERAKSFPQYKIVDGKRLKSKLDARRVIYRLPEILASSGTVIIAEGEKAVHALLERGFNATCNDEGAHRWDKCHSASLEGRDCLILPDNDDAGQVHASKVAASLKDYAKSIRILDLPDLAHKGDAFDWFKAGHTATELIDLAAKVPAIAQEELDRITPIPVMTMAEVMAMPPNEWLVEGQIPEKTVCAIYGPSGSGKTFIALDMMLSVAHNRSWHNSYTRGGAVFYIAGEGVEGLRKRLHAWHNHHQLVPDAPFYVIPQGVKLNAPAAMSDLIATIEQMRGNEPVQAVVFDTLARCFTGAENETQDMTEAIDGMDLVKRTFNTSVICVHHTGKNVDKGLRGSTALIGALNSSLQVEKSDNLLRLIQEKQKDDIEGADTWLKMEIVEFQPHALDDVETSVVLQPTGEGQIKSKMTPAESKVYDALVKAVDEHGKISSDFSWRWCSEEEWRNVAFSMSISTGGVDAQRKSFRRNADRLLQKNIVAKDKDRVWSVQMAKEGPDKPDIVGQNGNVPRVLN